MAGNEKNQIKDAVEFIEFVQRLTRNLLNDDQKLDEIKAFWNALFEFIIPSEFENAQPLKWAMMVGLLYIVVEFKDQFPAERMSALLNRIEPEFFYRINNEGLFKDSLLYSLQYFELKANFKEISPSINKEISINKLM